VNSLLGPLPQPRIDWYRMLSAPSVCNPVFDPSSQLLNVSCSVYITRICTCTCSCNLSYVQGRADFESSRALFTPNCLFAKCSLFGVAWPQELSLPPAAFHPQRAGCPMSCQSPHVPLTTRLPLSITRRHTKSGPRPSPRWTYQGHDLQKRQ
jgi:hypothetical protein